MADFEYSPFDSSIKLSYICPRCGHENNEDFSVPEPDWAQDSHSQSTTSRNSAAHTNTLPGVTPTFLTPSVVKSDFNKVKPAFQYLEAKISAL